MGKKADLQKAVVDAGKSGLVADIKKGNLVLTNATYDDDAWWRAVVFQENASNGWPLTARVEFENVAGVMYGRMRSAVYYGANDLLAAIVAEA